MNTTAVQPSSPISDGPIVTATHGTYARFHANPNLKKRYVSILAMTFMNISMMVGIGNDVQMAFYGLSSVFFYVAGAILFFIPTALVAAELATGWPEAGGIFRWVGEGIGRSWAVLCVFVLWIQNALNLAQAPASYTETIAFFGPNFDYAINFAEDPTKYISQAAFIWIMIAWIISFWIEAWICNKGVKFFDKIVAVGVTVGTILPLLLMIVLGIVYIAQGHHIYMSTNPKDLVPNTWGMSTLSLAATVFFGYAGIDDNAVYVAKMKHPERSYVTATVLTVFACLVIFIVGTLVIAMVVPNDSINVIYSLNQVFMVLGATIGAPWLYLVIVYISMFNNVTANIAMFAAPSLMFGQAGGAGFMPKWLQAKNKHGMPARLVYLQCIIFTVLSFVFELMPNVEGFVIMISQATTVLYLIYYILMFATFLRMKYTQTNRPRVFSVPGGKTGAWIVAGAGIATSIFGIVMAIWPPAQVAEEVGSPVTYVTVIILLCVIIVAIPFILSAISKNKDWVDPANKFAPYTWEIEGLKKPGKSLSNVSTTVLSYDQNSMGMPIKHRFSITDTMDSLPKELIEDALLAQDEKAATEE